VYLHTGRDETFGLSVLEAAWSGLPVVAVNEGGPREILDPSNDGTSGCLVPATVNALTTAILTVLRDIGEAHARAKDTQTRVRARYSWEAGAHALIEAVKAVKAVERTRGPHEGIYKAG